jgi:hypothetical protein
VILGFTGTRKGATAAQLAALAALLVRLRPSKAVHGDAVGADAQFHLTWIGTLPTAPYPTLRPAKTATDRAYCKLYEKCHPAESPLTRNTKIVADSDVLVACPHEHTPQRKGGTWHTIRLAQEKRIPVAVIWPDGEVEEYRGGVPVADGNWLAKEAP